MPPNNYATGETMKLFDSILAQLGDDPKALHPGVVIGFPSDNHATVALLGARYCETDGRKEATELGETATFFRADTGIIVIEEQAVVMETKLLKLSVPWAGPQTTKRGVITNPSSAICSPERLSKGASSTGGPAGGSVTS
jgi:hypothetical protein